MAHAAIAFLENIPENATALSKERSGLLSNSGGPEARYLKANYPRMEVKTNTVCEILCCSFIQYDNHREHLLHHGALALQSPPP